MDPLIGKAAAMIGLSHERLFQLLPSELTLWVDPFEVSYRIGEDGSICVLYESPQPGAKASKALESRSSTQWGQYPSIYPQGRVRNLGEFLKKYSSTAASVNSVRDQGSPV